MPHKKRIAHVQHLLNEHVTAEDLELYFRGEYSVEIRENEPYNMDPTSQYNTWAGIMAAGHSYMYGSERPMEEYIRKYKSSVAPLHQVACWYAWAHPEDRVILRGFWSRFASSGNDPEWHFYRRGEFVEFGLPHHDHGGEKHWATLPNFKSRILINVD